MPKSSYKKEQTLQLDKALTMIYWKGNKFWLGKLEEHPEIMTQGETLEELEKNLRDAYQMMIDYLRTP